LHPRTWYGSQILRRRWGECRGFVQVITGSQSHDDGSADRLRNDNAREIALFEVHHRRVEGVKNWTGEGCYIALHDGIIALPLEMETLIRAEIPLFAKPLF
jgi:hypothetical protein